LKYIEMCTCLTMMQKKVRVINEFGIVLILFLNSQMQRLFAAIRRSCDSK
jgi:hypothetical protein